MAFIDPAKPLATCSPPTCDSCPVAGKIQCHFRPLDLILFLILCLPGFLLGGRAVLNGGGWWFALWLAIILAFFGTVEIRVMCSHCPHYAEHGRFLSCWANHGSPKPWKYRPGPMSFGEKVVFLGGFVLVWGYPLVFFIDLERWFELGLYALCVPGFFMTLKVFYCTRCMNLACPLNGVEPEARQEFSEKNPRVKEAWKM